MKVSWKNLGFFVCFADTWIFLSSLKNLHLSFRNWSLIISECSVFENWRERWFKTIQNDWQTFGVVSSCFDWVYSPLSIVRFSNLLRMSLWDRFLNIKISEVSPNSALIWKIYSKVWGEFLSIIFFNYQGVHSGELLK